MVIPITFREIDGVECDLVFWMMINALMIVGVRLKSRF